MSDLKEPTPDAHWITYAFYPWDEYTQAEIRLRSLVGGIGSALLIWSGRLPVGRRDLAGNTPSACALMLGDELWSQLHSAGALKPDHEAVGSGVPLGTTGGTVPQDSLPGL